MPGGVEHLRYETTVRLRDACDDRDAMEREAALGVLDDAAGDRAHFVLGVGGRQHLGADRRLREHEPEEVGRGDGGDGLAERR